jgi:hypothetical protein
VDNKTSKSMYTISCKSHFGDGFKINRQTFLDMMHNSRENYKKLKGFENERIVIVIDRLYRLESTILSLKNHYSQLDKHQIVNSLQTKTNIKTFSGEESQENTNSTVKNKLLNRKNSDVSFESKKYDKEIIKVEKMQPLILENIGESMKGNVSFHYLMNSSVRNSISKKNLSMYSINNLVISTKNKNSKKLSNEMLVTLPNISSPKNTKSIANEEKTSKLNTSTNLNTLFKKNHNNSNSYDFKNNFCNFSSKELPVKTEVSSNNLITAKETLNFKFNLDKKLINISSSIKDSNLLALKKIIGSRTYFNSTFENTQKTINELINSKGVQHKFKL